MPRADLRLVDTSQDEDYQERILPGVSRTFALTIPELPPGLRCAVANAYLLCRIADTIEDEPALAPAEKQHFHQQFTAVVAGEFDAKEFAQALAPLLSDNTLATERDLVANTARVVAVTNTLSGPQRQAVQRCVTVMCEGMPQFERKASREGLPKLADLDCYCYYVAGVVGQMLAELFCDYCPETNTRRDELQRLSVSFGQGLQLTNILKDIWEDYQRGVCWLPQDLFTEHGCDISKLQVNKGSPEFSAALTHMVGLAHGHLRNALSFTLLIPSEQAGIRRFCLLAIGLALLTLRKIQLNPGFARGNEVKVSRNAVKATILTTNLAVGDDNRLRHLFRLTAANLPALTPALVNYPPDLAPANAPKSSTTGLTTGDSMSANPQTVDFPQDYQATHLRGVERAIEQAKTSLLADQDPAGYWCYPVESDCTIPAEYIMMMHFVDDIDTELQAKIAVYLRRMQAQNGGWPLYHGGDMDISCSVKSYYALKLAGDSADAPHMVHARQAILARGGAVKANVFTYIALAQFGQLPWRAVPFIPVEVMLLPSWAPVHLNKVSYWARTVMVPLFILTSSKVQAKNPLGVNIRELFTVPPEQETKFFQPWSLTSRFFKGLDTIGRTAEPFIPRVLRKRAIKLAEKWIIERLNGEDGIGAIFPAMVNAYEALGELGYAADHPYRAQTRKAIDDLLVIDDQEAWCQPCVSPVWDTGLSALALQMADGGDTSPEVRRGLDWLKTKQILDGPGDWRDDHPDLLGGGWAFQFNNGHYPDLDDTAVVAWAMHNVGDDAAYGFNINRAADWLRGMQSRNGGVGAFDADNDHYYLNQIPFADHGAMLDPPTSDVTGRMATLLGIMQRSEDRECLRRCIDYLRAEQEADGSWFGRWGTNYVYGTWSVLSGLAAADEDMQQPYIRKAVTWLKGMQRADGSWGEDNGSYWQPQRGRPDASTAFHTAWAMLGLMAAGEADTAELRRGAEYLVARQAEDGFWHDPDHTAPGFPRVYYLKYHGYNRYFPLWALAQHRLLLKNASN